MGHKRPLLVAFFLMLFVFQQARAGGQKRTQEMVVFGMAMPIIHGVEGDGQHNV